MRPFFVVGSGSWWSSLDAVESATLLMSRAVVEPSLSRRALEPRPFLISWVRPGARGARARCDQLFLLLDQGRGGRSTASTDHHLFFVGASGRWWWWWWWWWSSLDAVESATLLM